MTGEKTKSSDAKTAEKKAKPKKPHVSKVKKDVVDRKETVPKKEEPAEKTDAVAVQEGVETQPETAKVDPVAVQEPETKPAEVKPKKKPKEKKQYPIVKITNVADKSNEVKKDKKPKFLRQEFGRPKKTKLEEKWRRPRGIDSKKLEKKRGKGCLPSIGYKKPLSQSQLHIGYRAVRVFNASELQKINPSTEAAVIASPVGRKKRNEIIAAANKAKIVVLNPRRGEI
ncbi:MAG: hypothetical protein KKD39_02865 [Candidatus Altiarchaeota archaeon]|nr:hypothetical protein [Candidatus Altiarchaeota archaeon]